MGDLSSRARHPQRTRSYPPDGHCARADGEDAAKAEDRTLHWETLQGALADNVNYRGTPNQIRARWREALSYPVHLDDDAARRDSHSNRVDRILPACQRAWAYCRRELWELLRSHFRRRRRRVLGSDDHVISGDRHYRHHRYPCGKATLRAPEGRMTQVSARD